MENTPRVPDSILDLAGDEPTAESESAGSLYIPKPHNVDDLHFLHDFMDEFSFVDLVTAAPGIRVTHIPTWLDRTAGPLGTIRGHVARQNPQHVLFDGKQSAVVVYRGPHTYISPTWYAKMGNVPTWNFAVVHASGKLRPVTDKATFKAQLARLVTKFEGDGTSAYDFSKVPESVTDGLMNGIVGFEMEIELLEGKFKLGQERDPADRASLLEHLKTVRPDRSIHSLTAGFYKTRT